MDSEANSDFDSASEQAKNDLRKLLLSLGKENEDWDVPTNYSSCPVLYAYIYNLRMVTGELIEKISAIIPDDKLPWYAQLECYQKVESQMSCLIIHKDQCAVCAEDQIVWYLNDLFGVSKVTAFVKKIHSKIVCRQEHKRIAKIVKQALEE